MPAYNIQIEKLCMKCGLGEILSAPVPIAGGLLHRMYDVNTAFGRLAVKALNPEIMERTGVFDNYLISEKIASELSRIMHVSRANRYGGNYIQEVDGQYYLLYDFKEGKSLKQSEIKPEHAYKIGVAIAKIHDSDFSELNIANDNTADPRVFDWNSFLASGKEHNAPWCGLLSENLSELLVLSDQMNAANAVLSENEIICHGDLDSKNVLWHDNEPILIDWESAGFNNPHHDFLETALYWSRHDDLSIDYGCFAAFIDGYRSIKSIHNFDWETVLQKGFSAKLGWLQYSLKRSLGIKCSDPAEQKIGTEQVFLTIKDIMEYKGNIPKIVEFLEMQFVNGRTTEQVD